MIHIRLDEKAHRLLKVHGAQTGTSIQQLVEELILRELAETSRKGGQK